MIIGLLEEISISLKHFDHPINKGNGEYLEGMKDLGFTECLTTSNGKLIPTFRNPADKRIDHQIDHLFISEGLKDKLINCDQVII